MATFILVHGAWSSSWIWHRVAPLLNDAGHHVFAPTLTGLGERAHLAGPDVGLDTHVQDVVGILDYEDLRDVVLVGWSYAAQVITGVADQMAERLAHLIYLDGGIPVDGESCLDLTNPEFRVWAKTTARDAGDGWLLPPLAPGAGGTDYLERGELSADDARLITSRQRPQPLKTLQDPVRSVNPVAAMLPKTFIYFTVGKPAAETSDVRRAREAKSRYRELKATHYGLLSHPRETANLLLEVV